MNAGKTTDGQKHKARQDTKEKEPVNQNRGKKLEKSSSFSFLVLNDAVI